MKCPACEGEGYFIEYQDEWGSVTTPCGCCKGEGKISLWRWLDLQFWHNVPVWFVEWYDDFRYRKQEK